MAPMAVRRSVTLAEAAELTGLTAAALARRVSRGSLPSTKQGGRRVVALADLYAAGLVAIDPGKTVADLLDRLEAAYRRIGELEAENRRLRERGQ